MKKQDDIKKGNGNSQPLFKVKYPFLNTPLSNSYNFQINLQQMPKQQNNNKLFIQTESDQAYQISRFQNNPRAPTVLITPRQKFKAL